MPGTVTTVTHSMTLDQMTSWCEQFAASYLEDLTDPEVVADRCHVVSDAFTTWWVNQGGHAEPVVGGRFAWVEAFGVEVLLVAHQATVVTLSDGTRLVVDFTARQFEPGADVPLVVPLPVWREQWRSLTTEPSHHDVAVRPLGGLGE